eukprot:c6609_g1_i1.p1 GENE.c6609_g1_i1~~c6609_g1_i1.p1  ORF type:complete len:104 (+),score=38.07 c6609_g1_i1:25-312(+)
MVEDKSFLEEELMQDIQRAQKETVEAIKEDICGWLSQLIPGLDINCENFMTTLADGVILLTLKQIAEKTNDSIRFQTPQKGSFQARDNIAQFVRW